MHYCSPLGVSMLLTYCHAGVSRLQSRKDSESLQLTSTHDIASFTAHPEHTDHVQLIKGRQKARSMPLTRRYRIPGLLENRRRGSYQVCYIWTGRTRGDLHR